MQLCSTPTEYQLADASIGHTEVLVEKAGGQGSRGLDKSQKSMLPWVHSARRLWQ